MINTHTRVDHFYSYSQVRPAPCGSIAQNAGWTTSPSCIQLSSLSLINDLLYQLSTQRPALHLGFALAGPWESLIRHIKPSTIFTYRWTKRHMNEPRYPAHVPIMFQALMTASKVTLTSLTTSCAGLMLGSWNDMLHSRVFVAILDDCLGYNLKLEYVSLCTICPYNRNIQYVAIMKKKVMF